MVKKRYTHSYVEFILGHYTSNEDSKIVFLFNRMSNEEKLEIESSDFDRMWIRVWRSKPKESEVEMFTKYMKCKRKFDNTFITPGRLVRLLSFSTSQDSMWEIPKGHKDKDETELECAVRELHEETDIKNIYIIPDLCEQIEYTNAKAHYIYKFFICLAPQNCSLNKLFRVSTAILPPLPQPILPNLRAYSPRTSDVRPWHRHIDQFDSTYVKQIDVKKTTRKRVALNFANNTQLLEIIDVRWVSLEEIKFLDQSKRFYTAICNIFKVLKTIYRIPKLTMLGKLPI